MALQAGNVNIFYVNGPIDARNIAIKNLSIFCVHAVKQPIHIVVLKHAIEQNIRGVNIGERQRVFQRGIQN